MKKRRSLWEVLSCAVLFSITLMAASGLTIGNASDVTTSQDSGSCVGTIIEGLYVNCGDALLPITTGSATAQQDAQSDGAFSLADEAAGGSSLEGRLAQSHVALGRQITTSTSLKSVTVTVSWRIISGASQASGFAGVLGHGFVTTVTYSNRHASGLSDPACSDGSDVRGEGQTVGVNFDPSTKPDDYSISVTFSCPSGANIVAGQVFAASLTAEGDIRTTHDDDHGSVSLSGQLLSATFEEVLT